MTCATCKHATPWKRGFLLCKFLPKWEYRSQLMPCRFDPVKWEAK